jgi:invasion protein IalB
MTFRKALPVLVLGAIGMLGPQTVVALAQTKPAVATSSPQLPGGASALSETHGDWTVNCRIANAIKLCSLSHQQFNQANGQRLLAIELMTKTAQDTTGTLALPFGLALAKGVGLKIDDRKLEGALGFSTCLAAGCMVPVAFDVKTLEALKAGTVLKIEGTASDTGQPIEFTTSLTGFSSALARTAQLSAD